MTIMHSSPLGLAETYLIAGKNKKTLSVGRPPYHSDGEARASRR